LVALAGFVASAAIHIASIAGVDVRTRHPDIFLLHLLCMGTFIFTLPVSVWLSSAKDDESRDILTGVPPVLKAMVIGLLIYVFITGIHSTQNAWDGQATAQADGTYVLEQYGKVVRTVDAAEYHSHRALEARGFSGAWMLFFALASAMAYGTVRTSGSDPAKPADNPRAQAGVASPE